MANRHMEDLDHYIWWPSLLVNIDEALFAYCTPNVDDEVFEGWKSLYDNKHMMETKKKEYEIYIYWYAWNAQVEELKQPSILIK